MVYTDTVKKYYISAAVIVLVGIAWLAGRSPDDTGPPQTIPEKSYVALGDSVAAGIGLKDYSDSSACDRTDQSYPALIAKERSYALTNIACSGATTQSGLLGAQEVNKLIITPQIDIALNIKKPDLISITIGANDTEWTKLIQQCYTTVCGSGSDTAQVTSKLSLASQNIAESLSRIQQKYPTDTPMVIVTGYYGLFAASPRNDCTELKGIDAAELAWVRGLQSRINDSIETATAQYEFAQYTSINFAGHELCTADSWIQGLGAKKPYHPTESGQVAIAKQVIEAIDGLGENK